ncbi:MAG: hypothetical protein ACI4TV_05350, partial [Paludibacteraceae bacterium]
MFFPKKEPVLAIEGQKAGVFRQIHTKKKEPDRMRQTVGTCCIIGSWFVMCSFCEIWTIEEGIAE